MGTENHNEPQLFFPRLDHLEEFTIPTHIVNEELGAYDALQEELGGLKLDHALVIGRYQPLHYGHIYLLKQGLNVAKQITIGIGSANVRDTDNPFSPEEREYMLRKALKREGMTNRVKRIIYLDDFPEDDLWLAESLKKLDSKIEGVVGNNGWVNEIFIGGGIPAYKVPQLHRSTYEGRKIRAQLRAQNKL